MKIASETITNILLIDAGNSSLKWAFLEENMLSIQYRSFYSKHSSKQNSKQISAIQQFRKLLEKNLNTIDAVVMVSVLGDEFNHEASNISQELSLVFEQVKSIESLSGIVNAYDEPYKLGADRFVALIAAYHLSNKKQKKQKACIIIDSGTATTIDAVDSQGNHLGGLILPGVDLCSSSLLQNTQQLALWGKAQNQNKFEPNLFSTNTVDAINSASILGLSGAIQNICFNMVKAIKLKEKNTMIDKFLCGGSAELLHPYLDSDFCLQNNLIMQGLQFLVLGELSKDFSASSLKSNIKKKHDKKP